MTTLLLQLQSLWNPFRDWNSTILWNPYKWFSFKASETLLGIETRFESSLIIELVRRLQSLWNPFRDWNQSFDLSAISIKPLQSLWNPFRDWNDLLHASPVCKSCFKASETLLGIETIWLIDATVLRVKLQSLWNPFRDWNKGFDSDNPYNQCFKASETLLGIETLLLLSNLYLIGLASKPLKPF